MEHARCAKAKMLALLLPALLLLFAACGGAAAQAGSSSGSGAKSVACQGLVAVNQALTSLAKVGTNTTVGEVKATQEKVTSALNKIDAHLPGATGPILSQVQAANNELGKALQGYPDSATIGQTSVKVQGLQSKVTTVQGAVNHLSSTLKC